MVFVRRYASRAVELSRSRQRFQRRQERVRMGSSCAGTVRSVDSTGYRFAAAMSRRWVPATCLTSNGLNDHRKASRLLNRVAELERQGMRWRLPIRVLEYGFCRKLVSVNCQRQTSQNKTSGQRAETDLLNKPWPAQLSQSAATENLASHCCGPPTGALTRSRPRVLRSGALTGCVWATTRGARPTDRLRRGDHGVLLRP